MDIELQPGRYVVAVSGGVDSAALLHMLTSLPEVKLTVAHFDHGIRDDSAQDRMLVQELAKRYELPFVFHTGKLGANASEAIARKARYAFLDTVQRASGANAIITAHHEDDLIETAILNLLRGTGRRGLSSLKSTDAIRRPLLYISKKALLTYAQHEGLRWREDSTNSDTKYLRNYVRLQIVPRLNPEDRALFLQLVRRGHTLNRSIEVELANYLHVQPAQTELDRQQFILLPHAASREVMAEWLLRRTNVELSRRLLERLVVSAKTGRTGSMVDVDKGHWMRIDRTLLALVPHER